jgi:hypothetical protein
LATANLEGWREIRHPKQAGHRPGHHGSSCPSCISSRGAGGAICEDALHGEAGDDSFYTIDGLADFIAGGCGTDKDKYDSFDTTVGIEGVIP